MKNIEFPRPENRQIRNFLMGVFLIVMAYFLGALMNAFGKVAVETVPVTTILFFQNFIALLMFAPFALSRGFKGIKTKHLKLHLFRALAGLGSYACLFVAIRHISLLDATLLGNASPLFLPFVIWAWMGKKIRSLLWVSLILGFLGVIFILHPTKDIFKSWMVLVALMASLFSAIALQSVANLKKYHSSLIIVFYYFLISSIVTLPLLIFEWKVLSGQEWMLLSGIGVLLGISIFLIAEAYFYGTPTDLGPFNYSAILFAGLIQWIYWKNVPSLTSLIGIFLVCAGGILTILLQKKYQR